MDEIQRLEEEVRVLESFFGRLFDTSQDARPKLTVFVDSSTNINQTPVHDAWNSRKQAI